MKIADRTIMNNVERGILKRQTGQIFGLVDVKGTQKTDTRWVGDFPTALDTPTINKQFEKVVNKNKELSDKVAKLEGKLKIVTTALKEYFEDKEAETKGDF